MIQKEVSAFYKKSIGDNQTDSMIFEVGFHCSVSHS